MEERPAYGSCQAELKSPSAYEYLQIKNRNIVKLLDQNHSVSNFIQSLCNGIINLCQDKGWKFRDVEIGGAIISYDGSRVVAQIRHKE